MMHIRPSLISGAIDSAFQDPSTNYESQYWDMGGFSRDSVIESMKSFESVLSRWNGTRELQALELTVRAKRLLVAIIDAGYPPNTTLKTDLPDRAAAWIECFDAGKFQCPANIPWDECIRFMTDALNVVDSCSDDAPNDHLQLGIKEMRNVILKRLSAVHVVRTQGTDGLQRLMDSQFANSCELHRDDIASKATQVELGNLNRELIMALKKEPASLYLLSPRKFEEIVADLLRDMGCEVRLTGETRDGGRDIIAAFNVPPFGRMLSIVECKRSKPEARLGAGLLRQFLWVLEREDRANIGVIVTTATFSKDALKMQQREKWRLRLKDVEDIKQWLSQYGKWSNASASGLWLPSTLAEPFVKP